MKLWIDDIRPAPEGWIWVKDYNSAVDYFPYLPEGIRYAPCITDISFDHDLGEDSPTGYAILCAIENKVAHGEWRGPLPEFHIHSANPVGRKNMEGAIESIKRLAGESQHKLNTRP